jgi:hypothetical protein
VYKLLKKVRNLNLGDRPKRLFFPGQVRITVVLYFRCLDFLRRLFFFSAERVRLCVLHQFQRGLKSVFVARRDFFSLT